MADSLSVAGPLDEVPFCSCHDKPTLGSALFGVHKCHGKRIKKNILCKLGGTKINRQEGDGDADEDIDNEQEAPTRRVVLWTI